MRIRSSKLKLVFGVGVGLLVFGVAFAAIVLERYDGTIEYVGLWKGPATLTARTLNTPVGETTGLWHYHPGFVYNVVRQGTISVEDGCGGVHSYSAGQAFETSDGRVHRAYNLGTEDALESNMFIVPPGRPITVFIPNNEQRCGPPATLQECKGNGWERYNWPHSFADREECFTYVKNRPKVKLLVPEDPLR